MRSRRLLSVAAIAALACMAGAPAASAHTLVDPTTLTPPLKPIRVCYEDGPWVKCDTSGTATDQNEPIQPSVCRAGRSTRRRPTPPRHALVCECPPCRTERNGEHPRVPGASRRPESGPTVDFAANDSWHETFLVPGDLSSDSEVSHGDFLRISGMGAGFRDAGIYLPDGTQHGLTSFTDEATAKPLRDAHALAGIGSHGGSQGR